MPPESDNVLPVLAPIVLAAPNVIALLITSVPEEPASYNAPTPPMPVPLIVRALLLVSVPPPKFKLNSPPLATVMVPPEVLLSA